MKTICLFLGLTLLAFIPLRAELVNWTQQAISPNAPAALEAQDHLRAMGPSGLQALEEAYADQIKTHFNPAISWISQPAKPDDTWLRIAAALNHVGAQYDNAGSGLYWYTDFAQAQAAARAAGKPILSLRLLGRLDENLSCANSRFFRTTLYPSAGLNALLRDRFILYWESVRPAPVITIDFGDGRKLVRTITGNSIHYVLDANGYLIDALPGLYDPSTFANELKLAADAAKTDPNATYTDYQTATALRLRKEWRARLEAAMPHSSPPLDIPFSQLESITDEAHWQAMAQAKPFNFGPTVSAAITSKYPDAREVSRLAISKTAVESPLLRQIRNLGASVALDTLHNNYLYRTRILDYISGPTTRLQSLASINDWVYAQVFLTPKDDPWLGLEAPDAYSALDANGETN